MIDKQQSRGRQAPRSSPEQLLQQHRQELQQRFALPPARAARRSRKALLGPLVLLLASAALLWLDPAYRHESHASGEQRLAVTLADGSQALLDSRTRLHVAWHLRSRQLTLEQGQAQLAVRRQPGARCGSMPARCRSKCWAPRSAYCASMNGPRSR
ncbi:FecR domain-containing protein [Pseudomonas sp. BAY1663]|uniref:FecR domain-containing protein n=1 Tax=Pseudomonas sp. BAY1663 TaxID=1439940 RepID=UPI0004B01985|nr:FecR domain-containing protein [Pseudomonas sp. BAY1663]